MTRLVASLVVLFVLAAGVSAQQARTTAATTGAGVSGVVHAGSSGEPAARVMVLIAGTNVGVLRVTTTDGTGHFSFMGLPAGRFLLGAGKPAYLAALYGAGRAGRPGAEITLLANRKLTDVTLELSKGAVISGRVLDAQGQPIAGQRVRVLPRRDVGDEVSLGGDAGDPSGIVTDDRGMYRVFNLVPGDYVVSVQPRGLPAVPFTYSVTYFPAAERPVDAETIHLAAGEERTGIDMKTNVEPFGRLEGTVTGAAGPSANILIALRPSNQNAYGTIVNAPTVRPGADGHFVFGNVLPGTYDVTARTLPPPGPPPAPGAEPFAPRWAVAHVNVTAAPGAPLTLALEPSLSISGRLAFEGLKVPPDDVNYRVGVRPTPGSGVPNAPETVLMEKDGRFTLSHLTPGRYRLFVNVPLNNVTQVPDWFPRSAMVNGRDVLDVPLTIGPDASLHDITITMTDDAPDIAGTARDASGHTVRDQTVVVFPADRHFWFPQSRRIAVRQSGGDGLFVFGLAAGLPPGDYYVAAVSDLAPNEQYDSVLLDELARTARTVTLADGDSKTIDVKIATARRR